MHGGKHTLATPRSDGGVASLSLGAAGGSPCRLAGAPRQPVGSTPVGLVGLRAEVKALRGDRDGARAELESVVGGAHARGHLLEAQAARRQLRDLEFAVS